MVKVEAGAPALWRKPSATATPSISDRFAAPPLYRDSTRTSTTDARDRLETTYIRIESWV